MKTHKILYLCILLLAGYSFAAISWVHPGTLDGKTELEFVKQKIAAKAEPWTSKLNSMILNEDLQIAPTPETVIDANTGAENSRDNARRAYGNALAWYLTGEEKYATQAISYLNAWSVLTSITAKDQQKMLQAGWIGSLFGPAADIMLTYPGWAAADIAKVRDMFTLAFYPVLNTASTWNGNVDLHQISAMMAIAVFNEDETEFNLGLTRLASRIPKYFYLTTDTKPSASVWSNPTLWVDGLTQETCRDNNHHAQFGLSGAIGAMETAWHQGVDVYSTYQTRMVAAMELMGLQSSTGDMQGTCTNNVASTDVYDTWEIGYNHYHARKNIAMPNTWKMISENVRSASNNAGAWSIFYETLTHADIDYSSLSLIRNHRASGAPTFYINDGALQITSNQTSPYEIRILSLNGTTLAHKSASVKRGENQSIPLGMENAISGIYLIQVQQGSRSSVLLYEKP